MSHDNRIRSNSDQADDCIAARLISTADLVVEVEDSSGRAGDSTAVHSPALLHSTLAQETAHADPWRTQAAPLAELADAAAEEIPSVPGYDGLTELGRGGMGQVLKGRDPELGRDVAVKVLLEEHRNRPDLERRFLREARIHSQLQHPGVAPIHELGKLPDGRPYFTMKVVKGHTLAALLKERLSAAEERPRFIKIFEQVCQTLAFAHAHRVLHRDLKPGNVMVGAFGEVQVMDWGLAKVLEDREADEATELDADLPTRIDAEPSRPASESEPADDEPKTQGRLGTLAYMPPEQMLGHLDQVDERSDVFGLGAILCEILTGKPPYLKLPRRPALADAQAELTAARARLDDCGADAELVAISRRCLSPDAAARPRDAGALAGEVTAYLQAVEERLRQAERDRAAADARAKEERKRRKVTMVLAAAVLLFFAVVGGGTAWLQAKRGETERTVVANLDDAREWQAQAEQILADEEASFLPGAGQRLTRRKESFEVAAEALAALDKARFKISEAESALEIGWASDDLHQQVADFRDEIDAAIAQLTKEEKLFRDLDAARMQRMTIIQAAEITAGGDGQTAKSSALGIVDDVDFNGSMRRYRDALTTFGMRDPLEAGSATAAQIASQRMAVREALVAALDDWSFAAYRAEEENPRPGQLLSGLAQQLDEDDFRRRIRIARRNLDKPYLREVAMVQVLQTQQSPITFELLAYSLEKVGLRKEGIALLRQARVLHTKDFWVNYSLGLFLMRGDNTPLLECEEATGCFLTAMALRPESAGQTLGGLGFALFRKGDYDGAIAAFGRAIKINPLSAESHNRLGLVLAYKNDPDGAIASFNSALKINPQLAHVITNLGVACYTKNDLNGAIAAFRTALEIDPQYAAAHNCLGRVLRDMNDMEGAIAAYKTALEIDPRDKVAHASLGDALMAKNDFEGAIAAYATALEIDPQCPTVHNNLGLALRAKKDLEGAIAAYKTALEIDPRDKVAHANLGDALMAKKDLEGAIAAYKTALEINPRFAHAHNNLGLALYAKNDLNGAIAAYRTALEITPQDANVHHNLGSALKARNDLNGAIAAFKFALEINPRYAEAFNSLGLALDAKTDFDGAIGAYVSALKINPHVAVVHINLGAALSSKGDLDGAIASYKTALAIDPRESRALDYLGIALYHSEDFQGAFNAWTRALEINPRQVAARYRLATVMARLGMFAEGVEAMRQCMDQLPSTDTLRPTCSDRLQELIRLAALETRLAEFISGTARAANDLERRDLAEVCRAKQRYAAASRFLADSFAEDPQIANNVASANRYNAACYAALAGCGKGIDAAELDEAARAGMRKQALEWLAADWLAWRERLQGSQEDDRRLVAETLAHWRKDPDLAGIRDAAELEKLPEGEREACKKLWAGVAELLERAAAEREPLEAS